MKSIVPLLVLSNALIECVIGFGIPSPVHDTTTATATRTRTSALYADASHSGIKEQGSRRQFVSRIVGVVGSSTSALALFQDPAFAKGTQEEVDKQNILKGYVSANCFRR